MKYLWIKTSILHYTHFAVVLTNVFLSWKLYQLMKKMKFSLIWQTSIYSKYLNSIWKIPSSQEFYWKSSIPPSLYAFYCGVIKCGSFIAVHDKEEEERKMKRFCYILLNNAINAGLRLESEMDILRTLKSTLLSSVVELNIYFLYRECHCNRWKWIDKKR